MGFSSSAPQGGDAVFGQIVWNQKKIQNLVTPNIRLFDKESGAESYVVPPGNTRDQAQASGTLVRVSVGQVASFTDREKETGETNQWRVYVTLDSGPEKPRHVLGFDVYDHSTKKVSSEGLALVNSLATHANLVKQNIISADAPVQIGFYRKPDKTDKSKTYAQSIIRLPSGVNANGEYEFKDPKNFVRSEEMPPRGEPVMHNGTHLEVNGIKAYDYSAAVAWLEGKIGELTEHYYREDSEMPVDTAPPSESMEEAVDLGGVVDAVTEDQTERQRMAG